MANDQTISHRKYVIALGDSGTLKKLLTVVATKLFLEKLGLKRTALTYVAFEAVPNGSRYAGPLSDSLLEC